MRHREAAWRQRSRQIAIPGTVLFGRYSSWMGEQDGWNASQSVGSDFGAA
jgi:hypothetical protein